MSLALQLQLVRGGQVIREEQFESGQRRAVKIGSADHADLPLSDPLVSPFHAVVELSPADAVLRDLGSRAGTWWNGKRVTEARLRHGDTIALGKSTLRVGLCHRSTTRPLRHEPTPVAPRRVAPSPAALVELAGLSAAALAELDLFMAFLRYRYGDAHTVYPPPAANDTPSQIPEEDAMPSFEEACAPAAPEKYDTRYLVRQIHRQERRRHFVLAALMGAAVAGLWLLATREREPITHRVARGAPMAPAAAAEAPAPISVTPDSIEYTVLP